MRGCKNLFRVLTMAALLLGAAGNLRADQAIYDDALQNGWMNWSWSGTNLAATNYIHSGSDSIQVTYSAGWQGFYLAHSNFDDSLYTSIQFWINGGTANGRNITVAGLINGAAQTAFPLTNYVTITAGTWRQVTIPLSALHVDHNTQFSGFWLQEGSGTAQPAFYVDDAKMVSIPVPPIVHLKVNASQFLHQVDARFFGMNAAVWDSAYNYAATVTQLKTMGVKILRFPGGSLSDTYHWKTNTTDGNTWTWATSFDAFAGITKSAGANAFITVNYGSGTPQEAADWVAYSKTKGYGFRYWEIGNENYGTWENDIHPAKNDPYTYAVQAKDYIARMKAADPTVLVGVVVVTGEDTYVNNTSHPAKNPRTGVTHNGWTPVMLTTLRQLGVTPNFIIYHRYEQAPGAESDEGLLQAAASWKNDALDLRQQLNDYLGTAGSKVEIDCTENNSVYTNPGKQSTSLVNGLYYADSLCQLAHTEFRSMVWWNFRNGGTEAGNNNSASLYGWRQYGDYGVIEGGKAFPIYYVSRLLSQIMGAGDKIFPVATSDYPLLSIYGVKRVNGYVGLIIINKHPTATLGANIALTGFTPKASARLQSYGIPQDNSAKTGVGSPVEYQTTITNAAATFNISFAPYSLTTLYLAPGP